MYGSTVHAHASDLFLMAHALVAVKRKRKEKPASLESQVPLPISAVGVHFHQNICPSSNISTVCLSGDHRRQSLAHLRRPPISLATRGYGVTRGCSDQEVCGVDHSSRSPPARALFGAMPAVPLTRSCICYRRKLPVLLILSATGSGTGYIP